MGFLNPAAQGIEGVRSQWRSSRIYRDQPVPGIKFQSLAGFVLSCFAIIVELKGGAADLDDFVLLVMGSCLESAARTIGSRTVAAERIPVADDVQVPVFGDARRGDRVQGAIGRIRRAKRSA